MTSQLVRCISLDPPCSNPLYALRLYKQILITALNERILWFKDIFEFCSTFAAQTVCVQSCNERFNLRYSVAIKVASKFLLLRFAIKIYEGAVSRWIRILWWIFFSFPFFFFFFFFRNSGHRRKHEDNIIFIADTSQGRIQSLESCGATESSTRISNAITRRRAIVPDGKLNSNFSRDE